MDIQEINPKDFSKEELRGIVERVSDVNAANVKSLQTALEDVSIDMINQQESELAEIYKPLAREGVKRVKAEQRRVDKLLEMVRDEALRFSSADSGRVKNLIESLQPEQGKSHEPDVDFGLIGSSSRKSAEVPERTMRQLSANAPANDAGTQATVLSGNSGTEFSGPPTDTATITIQTGGFEHEGQTQTTQGTGPTLQGSTGQTSGVAIFRPSEENRVSVPSPNPDGGGWIIVPPPDYDGPPLDWDHCKKTATGWICPPIPPPPSCVDPPKPKPIPFPYPEPTCPKPTDQDCPDGSDWAWNKQTGKWVCTPGGIPPEQVPPPLPKVPACEDLYKQVQFNLPIDCNMMPDHFKKQLIDCGFKVCPETDTAPTGPPNKLSAEWEALLVRVVLSIGWTF